MAIKDVVGAGIGFVPLAVEFIVTRGFTSAGRVGPWCLAAEQITTPLQAEQITTPLMAEQITTPLQAEQICT
jgi:hypothetical protein